mmetsp:Transcript_83730/g.211094  ORF Transcript_83730/g.211094 Transcript_83730/m.211094 type:complete len:222 (+) Transcript_83730:2177-2842(+)
MSSFSSSSSPSSCTQSFFMNGFTAEWFCARRSQRWATDFCKLKLTPSGSGFSGFSSEYRSAQDEFDGTTNSRSSNSSEYERFRTSRARTATLSSSNVTFNELLRNFGTLTERRTDSLDWPQEKVAMAGAMARSSSRFFRLRSLSFASRACASASCFFLSSFRFLSSSFLFFRFSFSFRSSSFIFASSFCNLSRRSSLLLSSSSFSAACCFADFLSFFFSLG